MDTPLAECERRDPKGLYARARAGTLRRLTGIDAPYEATGRAELVLGGSGAGCRRVCRAGLGFAGESGG